MLVNVVQLHNVTYIIRPLMIVECFILVPILLFHSWYYQKTHFLFKLLTICFVFVQEH